MRFPIYEYLYQLNRNLHETVEILERIGKLPSMREKEFKEYRIEIEHLRADATQDVLDVMNEIEVSEAGRLWKQIRAYQKSVRDPDDVYFEVRDREEERRKQGLPSLIGILRGHIKEPGDLEFEVETPSSVVQPTKETRRTRKAKGVKR